MSERENFQKTLKKKEADHINYVRKIEKKVIDFVSDYKEYRKFVEFETDVLHKIILK